MSEDTEKKEPETAEKIVNKEPEEKKVVKKEVKKETKKEEPQDYEPYKQVEKNPASVESNAFGISLRTVLEEMSD